MTKFEQAYNNLIEASNVITKLRSDKADKRELLKKLEVQIEEAEPLSMTIEEYNDLVKRYNSLADELEALELLIKNTIEEYKGVGMK